MNHSKLSVSESNQIKTGSAENRRCQHKKEDIMIEYRVYSDHVAVKKYTGEERTVVIPNVFAGKPVTEILPHAFSGNKSMETIVLPDILQAIGSRAFLNCVNLTAITSFAAYALSGGKMNCRDGLPALTTVVSEDAFDGCGCIRVAA